MGAISRTAFSYADKRFGDWLYGEYSKEKLTQFELMYASPLRPYIDYKLDVRSDNEYLHRYGMGYTDIHDPRKLRQATSGSSMYGSVYHFVSRNVDKLYK